MTKKVPMPLGMKLGGVWCGLFAVDWLVLTVLQVAGLSTGSWKAELQIGSLIVGPADWAAAVPVALHIGVAYAFLTGRQWGRGAALLLSLWVASVLVVSATITGARGIELLGESLLAFSLVGVTAWYFFAKGAVVRYYSALALARRSSTAAASGAWSPTSWRG